MLKYLIFFPISIFLMQCENDTVEDCSATTCLAETLHIALIDKNSGENLIENGTYQKKDIILTNKGNNPVSFYIINSENLENLIAIPIQSTQTETLDYQFTIATQINFNMLVSIEKTGEGSYCCGIEKNITGIQVNTLENEKLINKRLITIYIP